MQEKLNYDHLYHYTDACGLLGILNNKSIWLSNIQLLNDNSEFEEGKKVILEVISNKIDDIRINPVPTPVDFELGDINQKSIIDYLRNISGYLCGSNSPHFSARNFIYVFSLSRKQNLLSQWRGYCSNGGFSIKIDAYKLANFISSDYECINLSKCIYEEDDKIAAASKAIDEAIDSFIASICTAPREALSARFKDAYLVQSDKLSLLSATFKHSSFSEEDEIRLISNGYKSEWLNHRVSNNNIVPYLNIPIDLDIISEVMIGPCNGSDMPANSLSLLLLQLGLTNKISIQDSESPLVYK